MAALSIPYPDFVAGTTIVSQEVDDNNTAIVNYINARNAGSASWDAISTAGSLISTATSNQLVLGTTRTVTVTAPTPASSSRTVTLPDLSGDYSILGTIGTQTITGAKTFANQTLLLQETGSTDVVTINVASLAASRAYTVPDNLASSTFMLSTTAQKISGARPLGPKIQGLKVSRVSTSTNHVLWDYVVLTDSSGNVYVNGTAGSIVTTDISVNGAVNRLDTGTVANNTWYYIYIISDGTTTGGLYSTSPTSPVMPSGYTYKLLVGAVKTNGSAQIIDSSQIQDRFFWVTPVTVVSNDTTNTGSVQTIDLASAIPAFIAWEAELFCFLSATYSAAGARGLSASLRRTGAAAGASMFDVSLYQNSTAVQMSGTANVPIYNESATDVKADWLFAAEAANRSSYFAYLYVNSFSVKTIL